LALGAYWLVFWITAATALQFASNALAVNEPGGGHCVRCARVL
jgi:hypothetical protein